MAKKELGFDMFVLIVFAVLTLILRPRGVDMTDAYLVLIIYFLSGIKRLEAMKLD